MSNKIDYFYFTIEYKNIRYADALEAVKKNIQLLEVGEDYEIYESKSQLSTKSNDTITISCKNDYMRDKTLSIRKNWLGNVKVTIVPHRWSIEYVPTYYLNNIDDHFDVLKSQTVLTNNYSYFSSVNTGDKLTLRHSPNAVSKEFNILKIDANLIKIDEKSIKLCFKHLLSLPTLRELDFYGIFPLISDENIIFYIADSTLNKIDRAIYWELREVSRAFNIPIVVFSDVNRFDYHHPLFNS